MWSITSIGLVYLSLLSLSLSTPLPNTSPNWNNLKSRTPLTAAAFTDWPTNVIMLGGAQEFGMWIPHDGNWYDLSSIQCLDLPAYALGACDSPTIDNIGVAAGYGPCSFVGSNGFRITIPGVAGDGYYTVGPPQTIQLAACGP